MQRVCEGWWDHWATIEDEEPDTGRTALCERCGRGTQPGCRASRQGNIHVFIFPCPGFCACFFLSLIWVLPPSIFHSIPSVLLLGAKMFSAVWQRKPACWSCLAERDEVGTALWSHVCVVIIGMQDSAGGQMCVCVGGSALGGVLVQSHDGDQVTVVGARPFHIAYIRVDSGCCCFSGETLKLILAPFVSNAIVLDFRTDQKRHLFRRSKAVVVSRIWISFEFCCLGLFAQNPRLIWKLFLSHTGRDCALQSGERDAASQWRHHMITWSSPRDYSERKSRFSKRKWVKSSCFCWSKPGHSCNLMMCSWSSKEQLTLFESWRSVFSIILLCWVLTSVLSRSHRLAGG